MDRKAERDDRHASAPVGPAPPSLPTLAAICACLDELAELGDDAELGTRDFRARLAERRALIQRVRRLLKEWENGPESDL